MGHPNRGNVLVGAGLLFLGILFLVGNITGYPVNQFIGPGTAILLGLYFMYQLYGPSRKPGEVPFPWPLFLILGGLSALADTFDVWQFRDTIGPLTLIIIGGWMLVRR